MQDFNLFSERQQDVSDEGLIVFPIGSGGHDDSKPALFPVMHCKIAHA